MLAVSLALWSIVTAFMWCIFKRQIWKCKEVLNVFLRDNQGKIIIVTTREGKVYVGNLENSDTDDNILSSEKSLSVLPIKSGYKRKSNLQVVYTVFYKPEDLMTKEDLGKIEEVKTMMNSNVIEKELGVELVNVTNLKYLKKVQSILIPLSEIISYRKYDEGLEKLFKLNNPTATVTPIHPLS
jgi:small nuclear ribonucleoprotein (snRNP)-like protein